MQRSIIINALQNNKKLSVKLSYKSFLRCCYLIEERKAHIWSEVSNMMMTVKCKKIKRINYKIKDI